MVAPVSLERMAVEMLVLNLKASLLVVLDMHPNVSCPDWLKLYWMWDVSASE